MTDLKLFVAKRFLNKATKQRLQRLFDLCAQSSAILQKLKVLVEEVERIADDKKCLRENNETLAKTPEAKALITRYVDKVNTQETRIEAIAKERTQLEAERKALEHSLAAEIKGFELR